MKEKKLVHVLKKRSSGEWSSTTGDFSSDGHLISSPTKTKMVCYSLFSGFLTNLQSPAFQMSPFLPGHGWPDAATWWSLQHQFQTNEALHDLMSMQGRNHRIYKSIGNYQTEEEWAYIVDIFIVLDKLDQDSFFRADSFMLTRCYETKTQLCCANCGCYQSKPDKPFVSTTALIINLNISLFILNYCKVYLNIQSSY